MNELPEEFDHATREPEIYRRWEEAEAFRANRDSAKKPFFIAMPPPNATGALHLGHALTLTIEDVISRWRRMSGYDVLWLPGTDHASIATERAVIRSLQTQQDAIPDPRKTLGRDGLLQKVEADFNARRSEIRGQIKALGASCDWSRERHTLDSTFQRMVSEVFVRMFHDGLIYRGKRIVNWDFDSGTTLSEDKIETVDCDSTRYFIRFGKRKRLSPVATLRPEMAFGYTALAVHPEDEKHREHIGKETWGDWPRGPSFRVKVIADTSVDRYFGLGVVGVTPAHDPKDLEIAKRHGLPLVPIIGDDGRMTAAAGPYRGMTPEACREAFVADLQKAGLLIQQKKGYSRKVRYSSATEITQHQQHRPVEYLPKDYWFIDLNRPAIPWKTDKRSLREVMEDVVRSGDIQFVQKERNEQYLRRVMVQGDWAISRQAWWGHRIPVWYRGGTETYVGVHPPGEGWSQDPDTLATWFSSAMWSWSTLVDAKVAKNPKLTLEEILASSPDYQRFHPMSILESGADVLLFWVARMILMTTYATGRLPFKSVYLHGLVLDAENRRMSTAREANSGKLEESISENGVDALRLALIGRTNIAIDTQLTPENRKNGQRFVQKLWDAARYVVLNADFDAPLPPPAATHPVNRWMQARLAATVKRVTEALSACDFDTAAKTAQDMFRNDFCDLFIGAARTEALADHAEIRAMLAHAFTTYLCVLHPFIPFVTEALWSHLERPGLLAEQRWPDVTTGDDKDIDVVFELVKWARQERARTERPWTIGVRLSVWTPSHRPLLEPCAPFIAEMINAASIDFVDSEIAGDKLHDRSIVLAMTSSPDPR